MQEAFGIVIWVVVIVAAIIAVGTLFRLGRAYEQIGKGGLSIGDEDSYSRPEPGGMVARAEQEEEIRQMLQARNDRRIRAGEEPIDVDAEVARLLTPAIDERLREEVRQLVIARNERRGRRGEEPLDVEAEVERQLRELAG
jgi:hypothetical protein